MNRSIASGIGAPLVGIALVIGSFGMGAAIAKAQPADGQCTTMSMTSSQSIPQPDGLTRAGQIAKRTGGNTSDGSMTVNCQPASHG